MDHKHAKREVLMFVLLPVECDDDQPLSIEYITVEYTGDSCDQDTWDRAERKAVRNLMGEVDWAESPDDIRVVDCFTYDIDEIVNCFLRRIERPKDREFVKQRKNKNESGVIRYETHRTREFL